VATPNLYLTSNDSGRTFSLQQGPQGVGWLDMATSDDGVNLVACSFTDSLGSPVTNTGGQVYTSNNSGISWYRQDSASEPGFTSLWSAVASSSDGVKLVAAEDFIATGNPPRLFDYGLIFTSSDSG